MSDQIEKTGSGRPGLAESGAVQRPDGKSCGQVRPLPDPTIPTPRTDAAITCGFPLMVEAESMRVVERELVEAHDKHAAWLEGALDATRELSRLHGEEVERLKGSLSEESSKRERAEREALAINDRWALCFTVATGCAGMSAQSALWLAEKHAAKDRESTAYAELTTRKAMNVLDTCAILECACSLRERESGHRVGCAVPYQREALSELRAVLRRDGEARTEIQGAIIDEPNLDAMIERAFPKSESEIVHEQGCATPSLCERAGYCRTEPQRSHAVVHGFDPIAVLDEWHTKNKATGDDPTFWRGYHYAREALVAAQRIPSQGHAEPHPDTLLLDFLEAAWPSMELDVHDHGDASLGLSFDDGRREGSMRADSLRDLLNHLRAHINNPENAQEPKP